MFVNITDFKSAIAVENILIPYKKGRLADDKKSRLPKEKITPQICMEVLQSTNYARNIKDMLQCITELSASEQAQFKDVVLACFDNREQPQAILDLGQKLAQVSCFVDEFEEAKKNRKREFLLSASQPALGVISMDRTFVGEDFAAYDKLICLSEEEVQFTSTCKFPKIVDVSKASEVNLSFCDLKGLTSILLNDKVKVNLYDAKNLPTELDFSMCSNLELKKTDFVGNSSLRFKDGSVVTLAEPKNLPPHLDVSMCTEVYLNYCDLKNFTSLRFRDGAKVCLNHIENLPQNLDVSNCRYVILDNCDLANLSELRFNDNADVLLMYVRHLPAQTDFSLCGAVNFWECDLNNISRLAFKDGAKVKFNNVKKMPALLDISKCKEGWFSSCDLSNVKKLVVKNQKQIEEWLGKFPDDWKGELVFTDELHDSDYTQKYDNVVEDTHKSVVTADKNLSQHSSTGIKTFLGKIFKKGGR